MTRRRAESDLEKDLINQFKDLIGMAPPDDLAELIVFGESGDSVATILLPLLSPTVARQAADFQGGVQLPEADLTELEAITIVVRLLAVGTDDPAGDSAPPEVNPGSPHSFTGAVATEVQRALRTQLVLCAVIDLLGRHSSEFKLGLEPFLHLEALRALRLITSPASLPVGGNPTPTVWWAEEDLLYLTNGEISRKLMEVLVASLPCVGPRAEITDVLSHRSKIAVLGALWSLAALASYCRTRIVQLGVIESVLMLLRAQTRLPGAPVEAALVNACGLLVCLANGSRGYLRRLGQQGLEQDALEILRRFTPHRRVACAGLALLGTVARDEATGTRLAASTEAFQVAVNARNRWPTDAEITLTNSEQPLAPFIARVLGREKGAPKKANSLMATGNMLLGLPGRPYSMGASPPSSAGYIRV